MKQSDAAFKHISCTVAGWLKPLLSRIAENRTVVVMPVMDIIDDSTFQYKSFDAQSINIGGFDWGLHFTWIGISDREKRRRASDIAPVRYIGKINKCEQRVSTLQYGQNGTNM